MIVIFRTQTKSLWYKKEIFSIRNGIKSPIVLRLLGIHDNTSFEIVQ